MTNSQQAETEVKQKIQELIQHGSNYNVDILDNVYHDEFKIIMIDEAGDVSTMNKKETLDLFRSMRDSNADPLSTEAKFNYLEASETTGQVLVTRKMQIRHRPEKLVFSIQLIHEEGKWQVIRETAFVQPIE